MKRLHLILNAHIDPIWLWGWEAGLDELLATCRSACDRLDAHPDLIFTRGEAWVYRQIEIIDPFLFSRIRAHIESGRWEIVGGWWIQPDCNQPGGWAMEKQIALGKEFFQTRFGAFPRIAYNVDSFGHAATLPGYMRQAGQDSYMMMRPGDHEMDIPSNIFRWRGYDGGPEVVTFRISSGYTTRTMDIEHFRAAIARVPDGIEHTMAFVGVGDHGGGPTEEQIAWCRAHAHAIEGWEMVFSSPSRYFEAIAQLVPDLPLVTGELQQHAIGCYSVQRSVKTQLRRAEHRLAQAEIAGEEPEAAVTSDKLREAWEEVCFHHFHDTLGGTCIPSAYEPVADQLGLASSIAGRGIAYTLRRKMTRLPDDPLQRIVLWNASASTFSDYIEFEPWFEWQPHKVGMGLIDEDGNAVPHQVVQQEAASEGLQRLLFPATLKAGELRTLRIIGSGADDVRPRVHASVTELRNDTGVAVTLDTFEFAAGLLLPRPSLVLLSDPTDTWSHGIDRYPDQVVADAEWSPPVIADSGPLMASWIERGRIGESTRLEAEWRVYAGKTYVSLDLTVDFRERHRLLKLLLPLDNAPGTRIDGIMGGSLSRTNDGRELPLRDWCLIGNVGVVCPSVYASDATPERLRLTLLRAPLMAHHEPHPGESEAPRHTYADQGVHRFRFRFYGASTQDLLEAASLEMERPPVCADLTRGMPPIPHV